MPSHSISTFRPETFPTIYLLRWVNRPPAILFVGSIHWKTRLLVSFVGAVSFRDPFTCADISGLAKCSFVWHPTLLRRLVGPAVVRSWMEAEHRHRGFGSPASVATAATWTVSASIALRARNRMARVP